MSENPSPQNEPRPALSPSSRPAWQIALGAAALYLLVYGVTPRLPFNNFYLVLGVTVFALVVDMLFTVSAARAIRSWGAIATALIFAGGTTLALFLRFRVPFVPLVPGASGLILICSAVGLGALLARLVREMKMLLPIAVTLALVDLYAVFGGGLVEQATSGKSEAAREAMTALTKPLPVPQATTGAAPLQLAVGFADYLFIALFFACFARFDIPSKRTFWALTGLLIAYMFAVALTGVALPALVPIAIVVIALHWRQFRYTREEGFALLYAGLLVVAILGWLVYRSKH